MRLFEILKADKCRYTGKNGSFIKTYLSYEGFRFTVWLRICQFSKRSQISKYTIFVLARFVYRHYKYKYGYDIPYDREIGPGLLIFHIGGIVFSAEKCGKNLTISQNVTVGMTAKNGEKYFPTIGDNVYLAPGCAVIGNVHVGNHVAIGTNAVVTKSLNDYSVAVGVPAHVISYDGSKDYVNNPID